MTKDSWKTARMRIGYNTNGFAHHSLREAAEVLSKIGYRSLAMTLERDHLNPPNRRAARICAGTIKPLLDATGLDITIETGARFVLDPQRKHQPTLISASPADRACRIEFLKAAVDVAAMLSGESVSLWSGASDDDASYEECFARLTAGLREVLDHARSAGVRLSFEPEPDMLIDTMARFEHLHETIADELFGLTLDVGHVHCQREGDIGTVIQKWRDVLWNIHIEDMLPGKHEHLMFGDGTVDFVALFEALRAVDYRGPLHVELSRHSHNAVDIAERSFEFLRRLV